MSFYRPNPVPSDPKLIPQFLQTELNNIMLAQQNANQYYLLDTLYAAPTKVKEGMIVKADGTTFNPGSGAGFYGYRAGAWRFLG